MAGCTGEPKERVYLLDQGAGEHSEPGGPRHRLPRQLQRDAATAHAQRLPDCPSLHRHPLTPPRPQPQRGRDCRPGRDGARGGTGVAEFGRVAALLQRGVLLLGGDAIATRWRWCHNNSYHAGLGHSERCAGPSVRAARAATA